MHQYDPMMMNETFTLYTHTQPNTPLSQHTYTHIPSKLSGIRLDWKPFSHTFDKNQTWIV